MLLLAMRENDGINGPRHYVEFDQRRLPKNPYPNKIDLDKPKPDENKEVIVIVVRESKE